jgi:hypothetical protein
MTLSTEFPALQQFFGSYFHQDWGDEFESFDEALSAYRTGEPPETLWTARKELVELIQKDLDEASFADAIHRLGCYYDPVSEGMTYRDWISLIEHAIG